MKRETAARLHSVAIRLLRTVRAADAETGLSAARLSLLSVLAYGGARTIGELAKLEQVSAPTMTRLVDGLEVDGYVRRRRVEADGRAVRVEILAAGRRAVERGRRRRLELLMERLEVLGEGEWRLLASAVELLDGCFPRAVERSSAPGS
jgi:DNA-binding MarR family transcriptional regulator